MIPTCHRLAARWTFALALCASAVATSAQEYSIADLGTLPGKDYVYTWELTLNNAGAVGVYANTSANPNAFSGDSSYIWHAGRIFPLPPLPGATDTLVTALNDRGDAVGISGADGLLVHGVVWSNGRVRALDSLPGDDYSFAFDLNNRGQVVGNSYTAADAQKNGFGGHHAVVWDHGRPRQLPSLPQGGPDDIAYAINDAGRIVGQSGPDDGHVHAVVWDSSARGTGITDIGTLGGDASFAIGVGPDGSVVGGATGADGNFRAFVWNHGMLTDLGADGQDVFAEAVSINGRGDCVGISAASLTDLTTAKAILWKHGRMIELQQHIPAGSGWQLLGGSAINERGQIAGYGIHDGKYRAFLLTPVRDDD